MSNYRFRYFFGEIELSLLTTCGRMPFGCFIVFFSLLLILNLRVHLTIKFGVVLLTE